MECARQSNCRVPRPAAQPCCAQYRLQFAGVRPGTKRRTPQPKALPNLGQLFTSSSSSSKQKTAKTKARKLLQLLTSNDATASVTELSALVDELSSSSLPFKAQLLGGGPWQVLFTKGRPQLWKTTFQSGKLLNRNNRASQDLNPQGRTVINKAEYYGDKLYVTASGTYEPLDDGATNMPKAVKANIQQGNLHIFGFDIPLPIKGTGMFEVMYLDDTLRIFKSGASYAVQAREDRLT
eukprot:jgi/Chrzof1/7154/Cz02g13040.t1